jgi:hypothetical protein
MNMKFGIINISTRNCLLGNKIRVYGLHDDLMMD